MIVFKQKWSYFLKQTLFSFSIVYIYVFMIPTDSFLPEAETIIHLDWFITSIIPEIIFSFVYSNYPSTAQVYISNVSHINLLQAHIVRYNFNKFLIYHIYTRYSEVSNKFQMKLKMANGLMILVCMTAVIFHISSCNNVTHYVCKVEFKRGNKKKLNFLHANWWQSLKIVFVFCEMKTFYAYNSCVPA